MGQGDAPYRMRVSALTNVDIVIVNWNAGPQLRECVESIFAHEDEALGSVTVVDNASRDGSADFCRSDPRVRLVEPGRNLGFGAACNLGAAGGAAEYVLFLNPDTRLLRPTLRSVASFMDRPESAGIGVCGVRLTGEDGSTSKHCARFPSATTFFNLSAGISKFLPGRFAPVELLEFDHDHDAIVPHVMGAFFFMRRHVFRAVGMFDEKFFVFYEDLDLSLRVGHHGYSTYYLASEAVFHRTGGTSQGARAKALSYLFESRLVYARKHYQPGGRALVGLGVFLVEPIRRIAHASLNGSPSQARETIKAMVRLWTILIGRDVDRA